MPALKRVFLIFLSSLLLLGFDAAAQQTGSDNSRARYSFGITMPKAYLSGIMITADTDSTVCGSMVNEFGVSAIDFIYDRRKDSVKLVRVIDFLNKWYIRRVLRNDIRRCLQELHHMAPASQKGYEVTTDADTITITNTGRKISYTFSPLPY